MSGAEAMDQFKAITGASTEAAKFYLDAAKGDLNVHKNPAVPQFDF